MDWVGETLRDLMREFATTSPLHRMGMTGGLDLGRVTELSQSMAQTHGLKVVSEPLRDLMREFATTSPLHRMGMTGGLDLGAVTELSQSISEVFRTPAIAAAARSFTSGLADEPPMNAWVTQVLARTTGALAAAPAEEGAVAAPGSDARSSVAENSADTQEQLVAGYVTLVAFLVMLSWWLSELDRTGTSIAQLNRLQLVGEAGTLGTLLRLIHARMLAIRNGS